MIHSTYHTPVLFHESIDALNFPKNGVVVDVTFGGGGHSKEILNRLGKKGTLIAFDQDDDALANCPDDERFILVNANFRFLINFIKFYGFDQKVDAILADLGVSSHQFDTGERGFSIREEGKLDMRMNQQGKLTAHQVINKYAEVDLFKMFNSYADLNNTKKVVYAIINERKKQQIQSTKQLVDLLSPLVIPNKRHQFLAQVFQAIRIEVNDEMGALKDMLSQTVKVLKPGGILAVISYHSIEDRMVKNFMKSGNFEGELSKDVFGRVEKPMNQLTNKPIIPTEEEIERNSRSRSAKLRVAEKL